MSRMSSSTMVRVRFGWLVACAAVGLAGPRCGGGPGGGADPLGEVALALADVPADVGCIRIGVSGGGRTLSPAFDVTAGTDFSATLIGIPVGTVTFSAAAFSGGCADAGSTATPGWVSDDVTVAVVLGKQSTVALTLHRNGRAKITVDFADEAACTPTGAACLVSSQCCSRACTRGACQDVPDAGADL
jgi:hypothetical protein